VPFTRLGAPDLRAAVPHAVHRVCEVLRRAGHEAFVVGGGVRDLLLGRTHAPDWDVATSALPDTVQALFSHSIPTGLIHGTVTVVEQGIAVEVTTYRVETSYSDGRRPDSVVFVRRLEDDLARRDFTVNAMALDLRDGSVRDPFGGCADLLARRIRAVGEARARFAEDGLRPLRGLRFAAVLEFAIDPEVLEAIPATRETFRRVARERVRTEMEKLLSANRPSLGLVPMYETGLLAEVLPALAAAPLEIRARAAARADAVIGDWVVRFSALHAELGPGVVEEALQALRSSARQGETAGALLSALTQLRALRPDVRAVRRALAQIGREHVAAAFALWRADLVVRGDPEERAEAAVVQALAEAALQSRVPLSVSELALRGEDVCEALGLQPGPEVGRRLRALLDVVLEDPARNTPELLRESLRSTAPPQRCS
jgi:tRNA nucleotidyltransferase (CCA-adding enzyme)